MYTTPGTIAQIPISENNMGIMKESAALVWKNLNTQWNKIYDTPFTKALSKVLNSNMTEKIHPNAQKKYLRKLHQKIKKIY